MMKYRVIPLESYPRREHFGYFRSMANPYVGVTVEVEITAFLSACQERGLPFFLSFVYCVGRAANAVPQLRQRIWKDGIVEFERCDTSHTVLCPDETYGYCRLNCMQPFESYLPEARRLHELARTEPSMDDGEDGPSLLFLSSLPWLHYTSPSPSPPRRRRTAIRASPGASTPPKTGASPCRLRCWPTTLWWMGCTWRRFTARWTASSGP